MKAFTIYTVPTCYLRYLSYKGMKVQSESLCSRLLLCVA